MAKIVMKDLPKNMKVTQDEMKAIRGGETTITVPEVVGALVQPIRGPEVMDVGILMCKKTLDAEIRTSVSQPRKTPRK